MQNRSIRNLGETSLRSKRRSGHPMQAYDALPSPLRQWLAQAALPWSPNSAKRIWTRARQRGLDVDDVLQALNRAETKTLERDRRAIANTAPRSYG